MGLDASQFISGVIYPTLGDLSRVMPNPPVAQRLVVETLAHESDGFTYLHQFPMGPALGLCQMEEPTWDDLWDRFLDLPKYADLLSAVMSYCCHGELPAFADLVWNLRLNVAMCRLRYFSQPHPLPDDTLESRAAYWGLAYQTMADPEKIKRYMDNAKRWLG